MEIAIIDYGSGNLRSVAKAFERAATEEGISDCKITMATSSDEVLRASHIVLPGVGAFGDCKKSLSSMPGMIYTIEEAAFNRNIPLLGICVGMQLMATKGHEYGSHDGLDWIKGEVIKINDNDGKLKTPHMGWNNITTTDHPIFDDIENGSHAYFVHSYHFKCKSDENVIAMSHYGEHLTAAVAQNNIVGTQFHPEKSQAIGIKLIGNFLKWKPESN
ncbi:MAG: imidazole glycerol phosphate synthase subunit HisH [Alphaproteobacteria bacterium]|nr:imidazole glycerol phosphate synthase subunit HisH [Alphaproteobacteria bacterium]